MCGIFGILDYKHNLTDINEITDQLAMESAERGIDATGIAYVHNGNIKIHKQAVSAFKFRPNVPKNVTAVIGHTRHSTQGDKSKNYNNHPWSERVKNCHFALAHNGVLWNDGTLQRKYGFKSKIKTDSYIAVQLLKMYNQLDFNSLKRMAETIEGSFSFNLLDNHNNLYVVKGDSPVILLHFRSKGVYVFASTSKILWRALAATEIFEDLKNNNFEEIPLMEGDLIKISSTGVLEKDRFSYSEFFGKRWDEIDSHSPCAEYYDSRLYIDDLKAVASGFGYSPKEIDTMLQCGFSAEEIEEFFYQCEQEV